MRRKKVSCFGNTESELEGIKEGFLQELNSATTIKQFHELLVESCEIDNAFSKTISDKHEGDYASFEKKLDSTEKMEEAAWNRMLSVLETWDELKELRDSFGLYASEALHCGVTNWEKVLLNHMETIAETPEQTMYVTEERKFRKKVIENIAQRHFNPTEEQLHEEFIRQSTL
jgi:hypothetical protein